MVRHPTYHGSGYAATTQLILQRRLMLLTASVRLMLHLASDFTSAIEKLVQAYAQIADCLPRFDRLAAAFKDSHDFQQVLAGVYSDILLFHERAYKFFRRKGT